jgi:DNA-binding phage protein
MSNRKKHKLLPFDATRYLTNDKAIAEYMTTVLEADDLDLLLLALGDVARARYGADSKRDWPRPRELVQSACSRRKAAF